jgi:hypothetical protein
MKNETNTFVIYNKNTGKRYGTESYGGYKEWNTEKAAKSALTRLKKKHLKAFEDDLAFTYKHITQRYANGEIDENTYGPNKYATQKGRDAHREDQKQYRGDWKIYDALCESEIVTYDYFYENEPMVERTNISCGTKYMERKNTPSFLSPSCDSYYR